MFDEESRDNLFDGLFIFFGQILDFFPISHQLFIIYSRLAFDKKPVSGLRFCDICTVEFLGLIAGIDEVAAGLEFFAGFVLAAAGVYV
jgi:hypothetical protein